MKALIVFGTRSEAIKLSPLILKMKGDGRITPRTCVTGQHREMVSQALDVFSIKPDHDLGVMDGELGLFDMTSRGLVGLSKVMLEEKPDVVIVQGDATSTLVAGLASFYLKIPVAHIEAGLRTGRKYHPFPEETNRKLVCHLADLHFAPTPDARRNLLKEGISSERVFVTGNTSVDAVLMVKHSIESNAAKRKRIEKEFSFLRKRPILLVTAHRSERLGERFSDVCGALGEIASGIDMDIVYPVHRKPSDQKSSREAWEALGAIKDFDNIHVIDPLGYEQFVYLMMNSAIVATDSGSVLEEAPSLGKPVLIIGDLTERPEAVRSGMARVVGSGCDALVKAVLSLMAGKGKARHGAEDKNPFGDGKASERIIDALAAHLNSHAGRSGL